MKQFCRFWTWSETECKTPAEYGLQHNLTPPPRHSHTLSVYILCIKFGKGGRGEGGQREVEGQQYTRIVPSSMGATVHKLGRKYQPWVNVFLVYEICLNICRKVHNRLVLKKSRHLGFGVSIVHSSMIYTPYRTRPEHPSYSNHFCLWRYTLRICHIKGQCHEKDIFECLKVSIRIFQVITDVFF